MEKYRGVAQAHPGTLPAALAWLEVADLLEAQGDGDASLESLQKGLAEQPAQSAHRRPGAPAHRPALRGPRKARGGRRRASRPPASSPGFPLRYFALADAARCYAQAGQPDRARELLERVESEAKDEFPLPAELRSLLERAARLAGPAARVPLKPIPSEPDDSGE